ncbi:TPA: CrpP family protein [Pseudomonas aeruginosa]|nr:CrpP family protein [Pseudomonas aeruginosa]HEJ5194309.1 CrpP family protein [Pseudomonas aeruginosa]HEJ5195908.1 CrpP family protein [Pseudomonas aeruginosa]
MLNFGRPFVKSAEAARKGLRVFDCPYSHPAMRASWLKGFAQEQQQQLDI